MSNWFKKITGVAKIERQREEAEQRLAELENEQIAFEKAAAEKRKAALKKEEKEAAEAKRLEEEREFAKLSPKEQATKKGEAWVDVTQTHVNKENIRNGFFELDWNQLFIEQLIAEGYGLEADPQEEIVDRWFREIIFNMMQEDGMDTSRSAGYINVVPISDSKSEVS